MKFFQRTLTFLMGTAGMIGLIGCTPDTQKIMTSVPYTAPIPQKLSSPATLTWEMGTIQEGNKPVATFSSLSGGIVGAAENLAVGMTEKHLRPSWFEYSYGPGQQAIFVTSLRDILSQNQVFSGFTFDETLNSPEKIQAFHQNNPDATLIQLTFMDTSATLTDGKTQIFADVDLTLSGAHRPTTLTHLSAITTQDKSWVFHQSFLSQEKELSDQLMKQAVQAIEAWIKLSPKS